MAKLVRSFSCAYPFLFLSFVVTLLASSCSYLPFSGDAEVTSPFQLEIASAKNQYRRGEAVAVGVRLTNLSDETKRFEGLGRQALTFLLWPAREGGDQEVKAVIPVFSEKAPLPSPVDLAPGQSTERTFLFTQVTAEGGSYVLKVLHSQRDTQYPGKSGLREKVLSQGMPLSVSSGKVLVNRYKNGLLTREDAEAMAQARVRAEIRQTDSIWALDEMGFRKWWVNVHYTDEQSEEVIASYLIDPYRATIRGRAKPFVKPPEQMGKVLNRDSRMVQDILDKKRAARAEKGLETAPQVSPK
jgi:hypothetical protein